jgi:FMN-dependent NADH-azoreductase
LDGKKTEIGFACAARELATLSNFPYAARMPLRILNIECSPRAAKSASIVVSDAFIEASRRATPDVAIDTLNVWDESLPEFNHASIEAKYKAVAGKPMTDTETATWDTIRSLAARFQRADRIVLGVPMWNFAYPYKLKQLIDLVSQRGLLFSFDGKTFGPLLKTPQALVIYTRGQTYGDATGLPLAKFDHQSPFVEFWLRFVGVQDIQTIVVEGTWGDPAHNAPALAKAVTEAQRLAAARLLDRVGGFAHRAESLFPPIGGNGTERKLN